MKQILLSQGKFTIIDDEDFDRVNQYKWYAVKQRNYNKYYAKNSLRKREPKFIWLHRFILGITEKNIFVDHINGNGLDNRKLNLRIANQSQNMMNKEKFDFSKSKYKGVIKQKDHKKNPFLAYITYNKKRINLGHYYTEKEAANIYNEAARKYFGKFARLNIIL